MRAFVAVHLPCYGECFGVKGVLGTACCDGEDVVVHDSPFGVSGL